MIILKEGKLHKHYAWVTTCSTCGSKLKILQGDPWATPEVGYNCDARQYYIRYICPVCKQMKEAHTGSVFGVKENATYEQIVLEEWDREEISSWNNRERLSEEELAWINNRARV